MDKHLNIEIIIDTVLQEELNQANEELLEHAREKEIELIEEIDKLNTKVSEVWTY